MSKSSRAYVCLLLTIAIFSSFLVVPAMPSQAAANLRISMLIVL